jgi:hypothetical protein
MTNDMSKNSTVTSKREWRLSVLPDYLRALHHPVSFVVLERCNVTCMNGQMQRVCERKSSCPAVSEETEESHEDSSNDRTYELGFDRSIF